MCCFVKKSYLCAMEHIFSHLINIYKAALPFFVGALMLSACGSENEDEPQIEPVLAVGQPGVTLSNTAIIYMAGENNLARFVDSDSLEIAKGLSGIPEDARVVVFIDDAKSSRICVGTKKEPLQTVRTFMDNVISTDSAEMADVLGEIFKTYPAEHYGITFWSHASGWVEHPVASRVRRRSYGIDNGRRDPYSYDGLEMNITTLANVLAQFPHTDYIFFDACFMQCVEVAYELRKVTDWVIGSPAEIPGTGAPYQYLMSEMCSAKFNAEKFIDIYYDYYETGEGHSTYHGVEISTARTAHLEALAAATRPLILKLYGNRKEASLTGVQRYCPRDGDDYYTEYYDIENLFYRNVDEETYEQWLAAFAEAVPFALMSELWYTALQNQHYLTVADMEHTGCMSMFTPGVRFDDAREWNTAYHSYAWYHAAGFDLTGW